MGSPLYAVLRVITKLRSRQLSSLSRWSFWSQVIHMLGECCAGAAADYTRSTRLVCCPAALPTCKPLKPIIPTSFPFRNSNTIRREHLSCKALRHLRAEVSEMTWACGVRERALRGDGHHHHRRQATTAVSKHSGRSLNVAANQCRSCLHDPASDPAYRGKVSNISI